MHSLLDAEASEANQGQLLGAFDHLDQPAKAKLRSCLDTFLTMLVKAIEARLKSMATTSWLCPVVAAVMLYDESQGFKSNLYGFAGSLKEFYDMDAAKSGSLERQVHSHHGLHRVLSALPRSQFSLVVLSVRQGQTEKPAPLVDLGAGTTVSKPAVSVCRLSFSLSPGNRVAEMETEFTKLRSLFEPAPSLCCADARTTFCSCRYFTERVGETGQFADPLSSFVCRPGGPPLGRTSGQAPNTLQTRVVK